jgi:hypothetical protein
VPEPVPEGGLTIEVVESAALVAEPVTVVASVACVVRLVGCTISLGTEPVEAELVAVISDTMLLRSEVMGSPVGSKSVVVAARVEDSVADSTAESDDRRLVGCTTSLGTEPVEAEPVEAEPVEAEPVAVISDKILLRSEVRGRPMEDSLVALVRVVSVALGVTSEARLVVSAFDDADELGTVVSDAVALSAVVAVEAASAEVIVVGAGGSPEVTTSVLDVTVAALSVSDCASDAVVVRPGPDGTRPVRMSDSDRPWLDERSVVVVSAVKVEVSAVVRSATVVALVNCLLTSRGKYIFRLATGSALAKVVAATSAETRSDLVCILELLAIHP